MNRIALLVIVCVSSLAQADSRAWTAGKKVIPPKVIGVVGVDASAIRSSELYKQLVPALLGKHADVKDELVQIKTTCGLDVTGAVDSAVVAVTEDGKGTIVVALKGVNEKAAEACLGKLAKAQDKTMTIDKVGDLVRYHMGDGDKDLYFRWLSSDTFAIAIEPDDQEASKAAIAGGLPGNKELAPLLAAVKTTAPLWFAFAKQQDIAQFNAKMIGMYGTTNLKAGNVALDFHIRMDSEKGASDFASGVSAMLPMLSGQVPPALGSLVKSIAIKAAGTEVVATAQAPEADVATAIQELANHTTQTSAPAPASTSAPATASMAKADGPAAMAKLDEFAGKMCACTDAKCAQLVSDEINKYGQEMAKSDRKSMTLSDADQKRMAAATKRLTKCMTDAMMH
jgi:hypothetical protein